METPVPIPPIVSYIVTVVTTVVGLLASQTLVDNRIEKLVTGLASILIPFAFVIANSFIHQAHSRVKAADIHARAAREERTTARRV